MESIKEGATAVVTISFTDEDGTAVTPTSATYNIYDKFSGTSRRTGTFESLDTSVELITTATDNAMLNQNNRYEVIAILVEFTYNGKNGKGEYYYKVENVAKVT